MNILKNIISGIQNLGKFLWHVVQTVFSNIEHELMADAMEIFHAEAVVLQNAKPGMNAKDFIAELIAVAAPLIAKDVATLPFTVLSFIASAVTHDLGVTDTGGNAGNVYSTGPGTTDVKATA